MLATKQMLAAVLVLALCSQALFVSAGPIFSGPPGPETSEIIPSIQTLLRIFGVGRVTDPYFDRVKSRWDKLIYRLVNLH